MVIPPFAGKQKKDAQKSVLSGGAGWRFKPTADIQFVVVNETSLFHKAVSARFLTLKWGLKWGLKTAKLLQSLDFFVLS